jgi:4-amino-4-deoxy-L-arabinose transferase-like glycosyltransferase
MFKKFLINTKDGQYNLILLGVVLFVLFLRFYHLDKMTTFSVPEINFLGQAEELTKNWLITGNHITSSLYLYLLAAIGTLTDFNVMALRVMQATISLITLILFYFFTKEWFNRRVALIATLFLSINAFYLALSRNIDPVILVPLFLILIVYLFTLAFKKEKIWLFVLSGIVSGLALYADKLFFVLPFVFALSLYFFYRKGDKFITKFRFKIIVSLTAMLLAIVPYLYWLPQNLPTLLKTYNPGSFGAFFINLGNLLSSLLFQAPINRLFYIGTQPLLDPFIAITFLCGLVYAFFHTDRRKYYFLIVAFFSLVAIIAFNRTEAPRIYLVLFPLIFIFASTIFNYILKVWFETFPYNKTARLLFTLILSFFVFLAVFYNYQKYFVAWSDNKEVKAEYEHRFDELNK